MGAGRQTEQSRAEAVLQSISKLQAIFPKSSNMVRLQRSLSRAKWKMDGWIGKCASELKKDK